MIVQNGHNLQSKCEVRKWKHVIWYFSIPLSDYQFSMGHVTSPDQGLPGVNLGNFENLGSQKQETNVKICKILN
jgi:hypothetical protein